MIAAASAASSRRGKSPTRVLLAVTIVAMLLAESVLVTIAHEARANRRHVRVELSAENAIVQVFVECRLAYAFAGEGRVRRTVDLGWLKDEALLTFQTRGRAAPGYLTLSYEAGTRTTTVVSGNVEADEAALPADRLAPAESWTVSGRQRYRAKTCQSDRERFAFAGADPSNWRESAATLLGVVIAAADFIPWALAIVGLAWLLAATWLGQHQRGRIDRPTAAATLLALSQTVLLLLLKLASSDAALVFGLCVAIGVGALVVIVFWLLRDRIHGWTAH